jgi:hypothetical protein
VEKRPSAISSLAVSLGQEILNEACLWLQQQQVLAACQLDLGFSPEIQRALLRATATATATLPSPCPF